MSAAVRFAADVALAWLMPWRAVRDLRESRSAFGSLCDVLLIQGKRLRQAEGQPEPRHLHLVE